MPSPLFKPNITQKSNKGGQIKAALFRAGQWPQAVGIILPETWRGWGWQRKQEPLRSPCESLGSEIFKQLRTGNGTSCYMCGTGRPSVGSRLLAVSWCMHSVGFDMSVHECVVAWSSHAWKQRSSFFSVPLPSMWISGMYLKRVSNKQSIV